MVAPMKKSDLKRYLATIGSAGGKKSAAKLTAKERTERARKAGKARQAKARIK
jgi:hypothetical protein